MIPFIFSIVTFCNSKKYICTFSEIFQTSGLTDDKKGIALEGETKTKTKKRSRKLAMKTQPTRKTFADNARKE